MTATQPVKGKCSVSFALEGRKVTDSTIDLATPAGGLGCNGGCSLVFYRKGDRRPGHRDCEHPTVVRCVVCDRLQNARCGARRERNCKPCAERHHKDVSRIGRTGARDKPEGLFFVTLTAPGADVLPWDKSICGHDAGTKCSGDLGCKVDRFDAAIWNADAPRRWNDFVTDLRRLLDRDVQYFGSWETQGRGLLHRHTLMHAVGVSESKLRVIVKHLARKHGFGGVLDVQAISGADARQQARTAGYIASYVSKGSYRAVCLNRATGELRLDGSGYRAWSCSRDWGPTIASVKRERIDYCTSRQLAAIGRATQSLPDAAGAAGALDLETQIYAASIGGLSVLPDNRGALLV